MRITDIQGRVVRSLLDGLLPAGAHTVAWDGRDHAGEAAPAGVYFYELRAGGRHDSRRLVLVD